jgi:hypothetical protein
MAFGDCIHPIAFSDIDPCIIAGLKQDAIGTVDIVGSNLQNFRIGKILRVVA